MEYTSLSRVSDAGRGGVEGYGGEGVIGGHGRREGDEGDVVGGGAVGTGREVRSGRLLYPQLTGGGGAVVTRLGGGMSARI